MSNNAPVVRIATDENGQQSLADLFGNPEESRQGVVEAARSYLAARAAKDEAEKLLREQGNICQLAEDALIQKMGECGVLSVKVAEDGQMPALCSLTTTTYYNMPAEALARPDFREWLSLAGGTDLVKETLNAQTFRRFCRELVEEGKTLHPDVKIAQQRGVSVRRS